MSEIAQQRYRVIERLAAGGMAEVFVAESAGIEGFKKQVAIKRVLPHLSQKKRFIAMFLDEARLSAQLSHSNVVQVFDIGVGDDTYFIVMEYVEGADVKGVIEHARNSGKPIPVEAAVFVAVKICEGLAYAHERTNAEGEPLNAVHRDMSPPNVLISKHGEVKIVDFGLAKASTQLEKSEAGIIKGKFSYLSPEAAHGREVDQRADIFSVGIILWEMLAGRKLFSGESDYQTVKQVQRADVPRITEINKDTNTELESIIKRALARDRDQRYQSARSFGQDLIRCLFRMEQPVSAFDIAELVRGPMMLRQRKDEAGSSIIDKLIQESLLEFTSLKDDEQSSGPQVAAVIEPFSLTDFEAFSRWADQASPSQEQATLLVRNTLPADIFEEGNLAALEGPEEPLPSLDDSPSVDESPLLPSSAPPASQNPATDLTTTAVEGTDPRKRSGPPQSGSIAPEIEVSVTSVPPSGPVSVRAPATTKSPPAKGSSTDAIVKAVLVAVIAAAVAAVVYFAT